MAFFTERFRYNLLEPSPGTTPSRKTSTDLDDEESKGFITGSAYLRREKDKEHEVGRAMFLLTLLNLVMFVVSCTLFVIWWYNSHMVLNAELRATSAYSPIFDVIDLELHDTHINGSFYPSPDQIRDRPARQMPNPAAEVIWDEWDLTRVYPMTKAQIMAIGQDPSTVLKLDHETWGLGDDAYAGMFDLYHQIHCLNTLRKLAYGGYYNETLETVKKDKETVHLNHCVDVLLQTLQCSGNMAMHAVHWVETEEWPWPDMTIQKKCINFDKLTKWRIEKSIDMDKYFKIYHRGALDKGPGIKQRLQSDWYYEYWGYDNPNHKPPPAGHGVPPGDDSLL